MLPGLKVLSATMALAVAILTFALGAAAILRATHESFASLPVWKPPTETMSGLVPAPEPPMLALLQIEPEIPDAPEPPAPAVAEPAAVEPAEPIVTLVSPPPPESEAEPQVVAALPAPPADAVEDEKPLWAVAIVPRPEPRVGPLLMPDIATNDAPPLDYASLDPATIESAPTEPDMEPLIAAPLPRPRPEKEAAPTTPRARVAQTNVIPPQPAMPATGIDDPMSSFFLQPFFNPHAP